MGTSTDQDPVPGSSAGWRRWRFGSAVFDERTRELEVHGKPVELENKPIEVLRFFLEHPGDVLTKDDILAAVWPGRIVAETTLPKAVSRLREVLADDEQSIIKTVFRYGYRFMAPLFMETTAPVPQTAHFDFKPGDRPPLRPHWSLVDRLGTGGHGEAWLVRHDKTREPRVFKFAKDESTLIGLKREVTLFRLLINSLGERARIVTVLDWNFEQAPFFIESEHVPGGSLSDWAQDRGGVHTVALEHRLEIIARVAEALATVHSVGVLHKDLKPSNVLVEDCAGDDVPMVKLGDLGSGGILDPARLEALKITRLGFTTTVATTSGISGTLLYLAPEVAAGQAVTVQADIYALGVMLYQIVVGDFHRTLGAAWERNVEDELICEDIALAASEDPAQRMVDAAVLAKRLRSLPARRAALDAQRRAAARAEAEAQARDRWRARRVGMIAAIAALVVGLMVSTFLYLDSRKSQRLAETEARRSNAVSTFLSEGVFSTVNTEDHSVKNLTVKELLDASMVEVQRRFDDQPETAAQLYAAIGRSYRAIDYLPEARSALKNALALIEALSGVGDVRTLQWAAELIPLEYGEGALRSAVEKYEAIRHAAESRSDVGVLDLRNLRRELARARIQLGQWVLAAEELRGILAEAQMESPRDALFIGRTERSLGYVLGDLAEFGEAETTLIAAIRTYTQLRGARHLDVAIAREGLARVLLRTGRYDAAAKELAIAADILREWKEVDTPYLLTVRVYEGQLAAERGDAGAAATLLEGVVASVSELPPEDFDQSFFEHAALADAYQRLGRLEDAEKLMTAAWSSATKSLGQEHPLTRSIRVSLADILRERGNLAQCREVLNQPAPVSFDDLPEWHPFRADLQRVQGLLLRAEGDAVSSRAALEYVRRAQAQVFGEGHWRTRRADKELGS